MASLSRLQSQVRVHTYSQSHSHTLTSTHIYPQLLTRARAVVQGVLDRCRLHMAAAALGVARRKNQAEAAAVERAALGQGGFMRHLEGLSTAHAEDADPEGSDAGHTACAGRDRGGSGAAEDFDCAKAVRAVVEEELRRAISCQPPSISMSV